MADIGKVINIENEHITVLIKAHAACEGCKGCSRGENGEMKAIAINNCDAKIGDFVEISLKSGILTKAILLTYGIPFLLMVSGFLIGYYIWGEIGGFFLGIILILISFLSIKLIDKSNKTKKFFPIAFRKISENMVPNLDFFRDFKETE